MGMMIDWDFLIVRMESDVRRDVTDDDDPSPSLLLLLFSNLLLPPIPPALLSCPIFFLDVLNSKYSRKCFNGHEIKLQLLMVC